jgi:apolipoprotein N-acyltransferase
VAATATGVYGISFEIMVVNAALAAAFVVRRDRRKQWLFAAMGTALVLQGTRWIAPPTLPSDQIAILVQPNIPILRSG